MAKYHVNPETGTPGICHAKKQCRFGGDAEHYKSPEAAREAYEEKMAGSEGHGISKPASKKTVETSQVKDLAQEFWPNADTEQVQLFNKYVDHVYGTTDFNAMQIGTAAWNRFGDLDKATAFSLKLGEEIPGSADDTLRDGRKQEIAPRLHIPKGSQEFTEREKLVNRELNTWLVSGQRGTNFTAKHRKEAAAIHSLLEESYAAVNKSNRDSFKTADKLTEEFMKRAQTNPELRPEQMTEYRAAVDAAALAYVSPKLHAAATAFEESLNNHDWITRSSGSQDARNFAKTYAKAAKRAGADAGAQELAEAFRNQIKEEGWSIDNESDEPRQILEAAGKAYNKTKGNVGQYRRELSAV